MQHNADNQQNPQNPINLVPEGMEATNTVQQAPETAFVKGLMAIGADMEKQNAYFKSRGQKIMADLVSMAKESPSLYLLNCRYTDPAKSKTYEYKFFVRFDILAPQTDAQKQRAPFLAKLFNKQQTKKFQIPAFIDPENPDVYFLVPGEFVEIS